MAKEVREPIQVYLTETERRELDKLAGTMGVSRSEVLRRGVSALTADTPGAGPLRDLVAAGVLTPARSSTGDPPRGTPVGSLRQVLDNLDTDRADL